jgi:urea transporter
MSRSSVFARHATEFCRAIAQTFFAGDPRVGGLAVLALAVFQPALAVAGLGGGLVARCAATFFAPGPGLAVLVAATAALTVACTIACDRLLSPWQLPVLVLPYVPAFALIWLAFGGVSWATPTPLLPLGDAGPSLVQHWVVVALRGVGQIFFLPDAVFGAALLGIVTLIHRTGGVAMFGAALAGAACAQAMGLPAWQVTQGLHGFAPALMAIAALTRFKGFGWPAAIATVVVAPVVEAGVIKLGMSLGIFGLSTTYVALAWALLLASPVQVKSEQGGSWGAVRLYGTANKSR